MALIKLNYELAVQQASIMEKAGKKCSDVASDIEKQINAIQNSWTGEAADALVEQLNQVCKDIKAMDTNLKKLASKVRKKASDIKSADESETSISKH